ncbi:uncharacterized protein THITE_113895 [Thermothielavioides terrestris NRRL 8126]|uniref:Amino acid permease/ SLC12A domain-containing protein n=1 Tax=Thermothielavioides terrestris (strain ATCC 38088 / NRRL 8126) TaxID=578455 RepID=G2RBN8_THETT|nr:uncharacterized protein THITE_113895 [Thermothielavioides terrestris NRRL 8126]AEO69209.1 hypothetical protein THITE_113895 [Thermothielavioides terrestris NRRL 8126]
MFLQRFYATPIAKAFALSPRGSDEPSQVFPTASKQGFWCISSFYIINLFIGGLVLPSDDDRLLNSSGANTKASPLVLAIQDAGIPVLPSIMNAVIIISVVSALGAGHGAQVLVYIDKHGRPVWRVAVQMLFGLLACIGTAKVGSTVFNWLLAISDLSYFFVWGSVWKVQGYSLDQISYKPPLGVWGSWIGLLLNILCLLATFYDTLST